LIVLHASDLHGHLRGKDGLGGYARLAAYVKAVKSGADASTDVLFVYGGDVSNKGALPCRKSKDAACLPLLKDLGVDVAVPGNHELTGRSGTDLINLLNSTGVAWTAANLNTYVAAAKAPSSDFVYKGPRSGIELAVFGWSSGQPGSGVVMRRDPNESDFRRLESYAKSSKALLLVTHQPYDADKALLAEACHRGVRALALLKADDHQVRAETDGCFPLYESGAFGQQVSKLVFAKTGAGPVDWKLESHEFVKMDSSRTEDSEVAEKIAKAYRDLAPEADQAVLEVASPRDVDGVASFLADAYRSVTHVDVAIVNRGSVKDGFKSGVLTRERFLETIPYNNDLMGLDWNAKDLERSLCKASERAKDAQLDDGSELVISGGRLIGAGTPNCRFEADRKSNALKVGVDNYLVSRSDRWLGRDLRKSGAFRFQVTTEQALNRYVQVLKGKL
jgi:2',3'-cyclic-nucleotide 2'-phosphodiesterase (5'-nucleotidase family)